ncbi:MAG TPA: chemotaxis protein CheB [Azospirillum sp.]|nr:chemotaxis protein CheB [Azospirillum sp.]
MECRTLIVIAASAGGLEALEALVGGLPRGLPAAVCVVLHIGSRRSEAPRILTKAGALTATHPADGEAIRCGHIYVAPPDHHLLVEPGRLHLTRGPRENGTRPAADPLFRSAADAYGRQVIGVVLSGTLSDGTAGCSAIKRRGGTTVVQDPAEARFPGMPRSALRSVAIDHRARAAEMGPLLARLVQAPNPTLSPVPRRAGRPHAVKEDTNMEGEYDLNVPVSLTCPDCGGAMREATMDSLPYFTCHIGHRYGADSMDEAQFQMMEQAFEAAVRALNERAALCQRLAEGARSKGLALSAKRWEEAGREARERAQVLVRFLAQDWIRPLPNAEDEKETDEA